MRKTIAWIVLAASLYGCSHPENRTQPAFDSNLSVALANPEKTTELTFDRNIQLPALPAELWTLTHLRKLNMPCLEGLKTLPPEIARLALLEELVFDCGNGGQMNITLPQEIGNLSHLTVLRLYGAMDPREVGEAPNQPHDFPPLPDSIRNLTGLRELDLGRNGLPTVPPQIAAFAKLESLDLSYNNIHELPEFMGNLKGLRRLSVMGNGGVRFPESMSRIRGLRVAAGNNFFDLKNQDLLRRRYPDITFDFENQFDDCAANEPAGGYPEWQRKSCGPPNSLH